MGFLHNRGRSRTVVAVFAVVMAAGLVAACSSSPGSTDEGGSAAQSTTEAAGADSSSSADASADTEESGAARDTSPVKIGVLLPYTGPFGLYGAPMEAAFKASLADETLGDGERSIELLFEDEATDPATAVTKATKLVEQDGVSAIICCATGGATVALGPILSEMGIPQLGPIPNPAGLSEFASAAVAAPTAAHDSEVFGTYAAEKLGYKTVAIIASDFDYGHEVADAFRDAFVAGGGEAVSEVYAPLGTTDFASYLSQIPEADATFAGFAGADAVRLVQQYDEFGLSDRQPLLGHGPLVTELVLNNIGPAAVGVQAAFYYSSQLDNPENKHFIDTMLAANPDFVPSHFTAGAWTSTKILLDAVNAVDDPTDGDALATAITSTTMTTPWGDLAFDPETGYAVSPTYYYKVVEKDGKLAHEIVDQIN